MTTEKLDVFDVIKRIDDRDIEFVESLIDNQIKTLPPFLLMKWLASTDSEFQLQFINNTLNVIVFDMYNHPKLLYKIAIAVSDGNQKRYKWKALKKSKLFTNSVKIIKEHYLCSEKEAREYLKFLTKDDILEIAENLGEQKDIMDKIKKEWK